MIRKPTRQRSRQKARARQKERKADRKVHALIIGTQGSASEETHATTIMSKILISQKAKARRKRTSPEKQLPKERARTRAKGKARRKEKINLRQDRLLHRLATNNWVATPSKNLARNLLRVLKLTRYAYST